eukprot:3709236-Rhodomonas_salina.3
MCPFGFWCSLVEELFALGHCDVPVSVVGDEERYHAPVRHVFDASRPSVGARGVVAPQEGSSVEFAFYHLGLGDHHLVRDSGERGERP